jgi:hypothetical protein
MADIQDARLLPPTVDIAEKVRLEAEIAKLLARSDANSDEMRARLAKLHRSLSHIKGVITRHENTAQKLREDAELKHLVAERNRLQRIHEKVHEQGFAYGLMLGRMKYYPNGIDRSPVASDSAESMSTDSDSEEEEGEEEEHQEHGGPQQQVYEEHDEDQGGLWGDDEHDDAPGTKRERD